MIAGWSFIEQRNRIGVIKKGKVLTQVSEICVDISVARVLSPVLAYLQFG
jgi:hypothetical protein